MEILKFVFANADKLGGTDLLLLLAIAGCFVFVGWYVLNWIYKSAFEKQKEVIQSQDKLIELKDQAIADYERRTTTLTADYTRLDGQLTRSLTELADAEKKYEQLREQYISGREKGTILLVHCGHLTMAILVARILAARLSFCNHMRLLVQAYTAICTQRSDFSGPSPIDLHRKIDLAMEYYLDQFEILRFIDSVQIPDTLTPTPKVILEFIESDDARKSREVEEYIVPKVLPTLTKHEPKLAERVSASFEARKKRISSL